MSKEKKQAVRARTMLVAVLFGAAMGCEGDAVVEAPAPAADPQPTTRVDRSVPPSDDDPSRLMTYHGIDVSHYQGEIDWTQVKAAGVTFAFIKATEGDATVDPRFVENWSAAAQAGVARGAYHFFHPDVDAAGQARHFLTTVTFEPGDLPPALDVEIADGVAADEIREDVVAWLREVSSELGVRPIVYSNRSFFDEELASQVSGHPLWVAWYPSDAQIALGPWAGWTFLQYSESGSIAGIDGEVDLDLYRGSIGNWQRFTRR